MLFRTIAEVTHTEHVQTSVPATVAWRAQRTALFGVSRETLDEPGWEAHACMSCNTFMYSCCSMLFTSEVTKYGTVQWCTNQVHQLSLSPGNTECCCPQMFSHMGFSFKLQWVDLSGPPYPHLCYCNNKQDLFSHELKQSVNIVGIKKCLMSLIGK